MGGDAGDVDNAAFAIVFHRGGKHLAGDQRPSDKIHVKISTPVVDVDLFKGVFAGNGHAWVVATRGIDKNGGSAQPVQQNFARCL